jgi:hypothetical protein
MLGFYKDALAGQRPLLLVKCWTGQTGTRRPACRDMRSGVMTGRVTGALTIHLAA